jgi:hypothetical protein
MSANKADLAGLLAETAGSTRHRKNTPEPPKPVQITRKGTKPITVHFPKEVRDQLKILAVQNNTTMHNLAAEAFNDLFSKYGKPEIAPKEQPVTQPQ